MINKILLGISLILFVVMLVVVSTKNTNHSFNIEENIIKVSINNEIIELEIEDYLVGVLASEMPASFELEALKAQAVASRSYAIYKMNNTSGDYDIVASVKNQGYLTEEERKVLWSNDFETYENKLKQAVEETKNEVMYYNDEVIEAFYFSMSNGYTEDASFVFNEEIPYIKMVESSYDNESINNFIVNKTYSKEEFCSLLNITCEHINISNITYTNSNRVDEITINNKTFKGTEIRTLLNLRSTDFTININDEIEIITKGYGHGVGMSQYGANGMAKEGYTYQEILNYYYQNITIKKLV